MQHKVHPESQVFQKQSIEIVLSSVLMREGGLMQSSIINLQ